jgi:YVTN family beta-propeller protein
MRLVKWLSVVGLALSMSVVPNAMPASAVSQVCEVWTVGSSQSISIIDVDTSAVTSLFVGPGGHDSVAFSRSGDAAYITSGAGVRRVDTATREVASLNATASAGIVSSPTDDVLYVHDTLNDEYFRLDSVTGSAIAGTINSGRSPYYMVPSADGSKVYGALYNSGGPTQVEVIDTATFTSTLHSLEVVAADFSQPWGVAVSQDGGTLYVGARLSGKLRVLDTSNMSITATVSAMGSIADLALVPDGSKLLATDTAANVVRVVDTATLQVVATIGVGAGPFAIAVDSTGTYAYTANFNQNTVSKIDLSSNTVVESIPVQDFPQNIGINCRAVAQQAPAPSVPPVPILRVTMDPNGGVCTDGSKTYDEKWTSVFLGYRYLPGEDDCVGDGLVFTGWAPASAPTDPLDLPMLVDPSDGKMRAFVAANYDLVAMWFEPEVEEVLEDLSGTAPGTFVGGPDRRTLEGGGVVIGYYIPPGIVFGPWALPPN